LLSPIKTLVLDTLFPVYCLDCHKEGSWICEECFSRMETLPFQVCPRCEKLIISGGKLCQKCQQLSRKNKDFSLEALIVSSRYADSRIARMIHLFKYNFIEDLKTPLGKIMLQAFFNHQIPLPDALLPVPLHHRKLRARGFNQAELLADFLSENLAPGIIFPVFKNVLNRKRLAFSQMKIKNYKERRKNVQGVFAISHPEEIKRKNILLVDDVATTGATLLECARVLKTAGARKVSAIVVARQEFKHLNPPL
jgi:competence protein ComFC